MRIAVTGSHGFIARHLIPVLEARGHEIVRVVRSSQPGPGEISWDPAAGRIDAAGLAGVDGVIHLAGVGIGDRRWNEAHKQAVLNSRIQGTTLLASTLASLDPKPQVVISASAIGFYGNRGDEELDETSPSGDDFLAEVCRRWEASTAAAAAAGIRTVLARTGIVQAADGGALLPQLPLFKLGLGARFGRGQQWVSWIAIEDEVGGIVHALEHDEISGPLNLVGPAPVTNAEYTRTLGRVLSRPAFWVVPPIAVKVILGPEMAEELLLVSQRVKPGVLERTGYRFGQTQLESALHSVLGR
jgi:uncharacterized protein (TIGR01777 family)